MIKRFRKVSGPVAAAVALAAAALACVAVLAMGTSAQAQDKDYSSYVGLDGLTQEMYEQYLADGSLEERVAFAQQYAHENVSTSLVAQAQAREDQGQSSLESTRPGLWDSGMGTSGEAKVVALRVDFPDYEFVAEDTLEGLESMINADANPDSEAYPYESLKAYYQRASYGALTISGSAYNYTAAHERSYYNGNIPKLFEEALTALDAEVDYSQFDGNEDGKIDCVYLHFAGPDTGWGSEWWSYQVNYTGTITQSFDGKAVCNVSMLHHGSEYYMGVPVLIHETGHVLGLPDLYSYVHHGDPSAGRTGTYSWDMMENTTGDHNGFFKWLLGWIKTDDILRVVADDSGITVLKGSTQIAQIPMPASGKVSYDAVLDSFDSEDLSKSGGFIVVSNKNEGMFASYYAIQYDTYAGNQSVLYNDTQGGTQKNTPVPSGFRVYRIQSQIDSSGALKHSNTSEEPTNQLLEVLDLDGKLSHSGMEGIAAAVDGKAYHCNLQAGDTVDYQGYPSTNFLEDAHQGFTGLSFTALSCGEDQGSIRIGYSREGQPTAEGFSLICENPDEVTNLGIINFTTPWKVRMAGYNVRATVTVDDCSTAMHVLLKGTSISVPLSLSMDQISPESKVTVTFEDKAFIIGSAFGEDVYSQEMTYELSAGSQAKVTESGVMKAVSGEGTVKLAAADTWEDTTYLLWLEWQSGSTTFKAHLAVQDSDDLGNGESFDIEGFDESLSGLSKSNTSRLAVYAKDKAVLACPLRGQDFGTQCFFWIDLAQKKVIARAQTTGASTSWTVDVNGAVFLDASGAQKCLTPVADGSAVVQSLAYDFDADHTVLQTVPMDDGCVLICTCKASEAMSSKRLTSMYVVSCEDLAACLAGQGASARVPQSVLAQAKASFSLTQENSPSVLAAAGLPDGGLALLVQGYDSLGSPADVQLIRLSASGQLAGTMVVDDINPPVSSESKDFARAYTRLAASEAGNLAVVRSTKVSNYDSSAEIFVLRASDIGTYERTKDCAQYMSSDGNGLGVWVSGSTWADIDKRATDKDRSTYYYLVKASEDPTPAPTPVVPSAGDPAASSLAYLLAVAVFAGGVLACARRSRE